MCEGGPLHFHVLPLDTYRPALDCYSTWIEQQSRSAFNNWLSRMNGADRGNLEGAIGEAVAWDYLAGRTSQAEAVYQGISGGPDFVFTHEGARLALEVKTIATSTITNRSGLPDTFTHHKPAYGYALATWDIRERIIGTREQTNIAPIPRLVFVITLHQLASQRLFGRHAVECVAMSTSHLEAPWHPETGFAHPLQETRGLSDSVFFKPQDPMDPVHGRSSGLAAPWLAGFMLGGFGVPPSETRVYGAINAESEHPLSPSLLPDIPWLVVARTAPDSFDAQWTITEEDERAASAAAAERRLRKAGHGHWVDRWKDEDRA